jgi:hypothetical protein
MQAALVAVPPLSQWNSIVEIKERHLKKSLSRTPYPHVTILPSAPAAHLDGARDIQRALASVEPFDVSLNSMVVGTRSCSLFLVPETHPANSFEHAHKAVAKVAPRCTDMSLPHIGLGHFTSIDDCERHREKYMKTWEPVKFTVRHLFILELRDGPDAPWTVAAALPLAGVPEDEEPVLRVGCQATLSKQL